MKKIYLENNSTPLRVSSSILNNNIFLKTKVENINSREDAKLLLRKNIYIKNGDHIHIDQALNEKNKLLNFYLFKKVSIESSIAFSQGV